MSDHFSGPRAIAGPQCDICDFYAFSSPERTGNLVLVTNVVPNAAPGATFSDAIVYRFRLRTATVGAGSDARFGLGKNEYVIDCTFGPARAGQNGEPIQAGLCVAPNGERVAFVLGDERGGSGVGVRAFAGRRADPFFIDFGGLQASMKSGTLAFKNPGTQTGPGANVLSLVVEIECGIALPSGAGPLLAAVGETVAAGPLGIRLERMGRPEVKNVLLNLRAHDTVNRTIELRDLYNLEDAFHVGPDYRDAYKARMSSNLAAFDRLDGSVEWPTNANGDHPLTSLIMADYLVVDVTKPFADEGFLEIEQSMMAGREHQTSGGRSLNNDSMDALYTLYINGGKGPRISDGVDRGTGTASMAFPYLVPPNAQRDIPLAGAASIVGAQEQSAKGHSHPHTHPHTHAHRNTNSYTVATADGGHEHKRFGRYGE
jgi:hypothetical protein